MSKSSRPVTSRNQKRQAAQFAKAMARAEFGRFYGYATSWPKAVVAQSRNPATVPKVARKI